MKSCVCLLCVVALCGHVACGDDDKGGSSSNNVMGQTNMNSSSSSSDSTAPTSTQGSGTSATTSATSATGTGTGSTTTQPPATRAAMDGIRAPGVVVDFAQDATELATEAVWLASQEATGGQQLVATGTLTQVGQTLNFTYQAGPADRLVLAFSNGDKTEFVVRAFEGDLTGNAANFLKKDRNLQFNVTSKAGSVDVISGQLNGEFQNSIKGTLMYEGESYLVDLTSAGTISSDVGSTVNYSSSEVFTGTVSSPLLSVQVNETHDFKLVVFDKGVVNSTRTANNTWSAGGDTYALQNFFVRFEELDGWPNPTDYWRAEGVVLRNNMPVGQVLLKKDPLFIYLNLQLDGKVETLQSWQLKQ